MQNDFSTMTMVLLIPLCPCWNRINIKLIQSDLWHYITQHFLSVISEHPNLLSSLSVGDCSALDQLKFCLQENDYTQNILHYLISNYGYDNTQFGLEMKAQTSLVTKPNSVPMHLKLSGICRGDMLMCGFPMDAKKLENSKFHVKR
jgi:hypothetical protein